MKKIPPQKQISLAPSEGTIVFKHTGIEFIYPEPMSGAPIEMRDTMDFLKYALARKDWVSKWWEELETLAALEDLTEKQAETSKLPTLTVLEGGLAKKTNES